jgi:hypothetical protein
MPRKEIDSNHSSSLPGSELFKTLQEINREVEFGLKLSKDLNASYSVTDVFTAYQKWLSDEMAVHADDARHLMSDGQKIMDVTSRLLSNGWTSADTTTQ